MINTGNLIFFLRGRLGEDLAREPHPKARAAIERKLAIVEEFAELHASEERLTDALKQARHAQPRPGVPEARRLRKVGDMTASPARLGLAAVTVAGIIAAFPLAAWLLGRGDTDAAKPRPSPTSSATRAVSQPYDGHQETPTERPAEPHAGELVEVIRVVDGDTIHVDRDGTRVKVRIIGLDTPEVGDCWFDESTDRATELLDGETVRIQPDPTQDDVDRYGRELHDVWLPDGRLFAEVMVTEGQARAYVYDGDDPNRHAERFAAAEVRARSDGVGLWSACGVQS